MTIRALFVEADAPSFLMHRIGTASALLRTGCEVHLAAPDAPEREAIEGRGYPFHPIDLSRGSTSPWAAASCVLALRSLYARLAPDLVHHVALKPVLYGTYAAHLARVPAIVNGITGLGYLFTEGSRRAALLRRVFVAIARPALARPNVHTLFENPDDLAAFSRLRLVGAGGGTVVHGTGVDTSEYRPAPEPPGTPVVILASRMLWDKGVGVFVEAARIVRARGLAARFLLVGVPDPENPRSVPAEQLQAWHDAGVVEWLGFRRDVPRLLASSAVVALPTMYREGVPRILIEAASCGRAAITTDSPGCRDVVRHGENGLLVPPGDAGALAEAVARLLGDGALRARMGARGRELVERTFAQEHVAAATLEVYRRLVPRLAAAPSLA